MINLTLQQVAEILGGKLIGDGKLEIANVSTDTRKFVERGLFFALKGENFDAHNYLANAAKQGCMAAVVEREIAVDLPQIIVANTALALGQLAKWLRLTLNPKVVAITGSSGKTTVKEMTAAILQSAVGFEKVLFTQGNFNNDIGVPLTLLRLEPKHEFAVIELGANHPNEIAYTTDLARPDVALVNNVAAAHLEGFGSIEGVASAKGEIYRGLSEKGVAIINLAHNYQDKWQKEIGDRKVQFFAFDDTKADFYASNIQHHENGVDFMLHSPKGAVQINLLYLGAHNVSNALAAAALAMNVGANLENVQQGLQIRAQVKGRLFPIEPCDNLLLLDDTYNANVASLQSAISVLEKYDAFRILAVGDMAELGDNSKLCHQQVAKFADEANLDLIVSYGAQSAVYSGKNFSDKSALVAYLEPIIQQKLDQKQKVVLLAKGSRSMKMEEVVEALKEKFSC